MIAKYEHSMELGVLFYYKQLLTLWLYLHLCGGH